MRTKIKEASDRRYYMSKNEELLQKKLMQLLRDNNHAAYARRLEKFIVQIVPKKADPDFTAAISFDDGVIFISELFLTGRDARMWEQLDVLLRHELSHNLMMHDVRMMYELGRKMHKKFRSSATFHEILNIIMDDEISNKRYTARDKEIVRNMTRDGELIGGLVTEDHRGDWKEMSLEEMYRMVLEETKKIEADILAGREVVIKPDDPVGRGIAKMIATYHDIDSDSSIRGDLGKFIANGCQWKTKDGVTQWAKNYRDIAEAIYNGLKDDKDLDNDKLEELLKSIQRSDVVTPIDILSPSTGEVLCTANTPEEKYVAIEILKKFRTEYDAWYKKVLALLSDRTKFSDDDITKISDSIK